MIGAVTGANEVVRQAPTELRRGDDATFGGGAVAALAAALAADLVRAAAASAAEWEDRPGVAAQAAALRARLAALAQTNEAAYAAALAALGAPAGVAQEQRDFHIAEALSRAADVPLAIASAACDVADLAAVVARDGDPRRRADAAAAAALADGAVRAAANLVATNLVAGADLERTRRAAAFAEHSARAANRALEAES